MNLILGSGSPRRKELLSQVGAEYVVQVSDVEEIITPGLHPAELVQSLALQKAEAVAKNCTEGVVLGADTIVVFEDRIFGKPKDRADAKRMLETLSGRWHQVMTGVALVDASGVKESWNSVEITNILFRQLSDKEIEAYLDSKEGEDKAGSYGIQGIGALLVERIEGDYFNVVGLPLVRVAEGLKQFGIELLK